MSEDSKEHDKPRLNESLVCDVCGRFGAAEFGDRKLCLDCYEGYGSCCPEFGREECGEREEPAGAPSAEVQSQTPQRR